MSVTAKRLVSGSLIATSAATTYYTAPVNTKAVIKAAALTNNTTTAAKVTMYLVPSGGAASAANEIIAGVNIGGGLTYNCPEAVNQVLEAGGLIQASCDTISAVSIVVSGYEIA